MCVSENGGLGLAIVASNVGDSFDSEAESSSVVLVCATNSTSLTLLLGDDRHSFCEVVRVGLGEVCMSICCCFRWFGCCCCCFVLDICVVVLVFVDITFDAEVCEGAVSIVLGNEYVDCTALGND